MTVVQGKELKGYAYADGTHWHWGDQEVAITDDHTSEIQWLDRRSRFPKELIEAIRDKVKPPIGTWVVQVRQIDMSATQHAFDVQINGKSVCTFGDGLSIGEVVYSDDPKLKENPGKWVTACFWNKMDSVYHQSLRAKQAFNPEWREEK